MSNSLRDQLLKSGLVDEKKLRQERQNRKKPKGRRNGAKPAVQDSAALQLRERQAQRSRELNRKQQEAAERKARAAQIRQIILDQRLPREDGDQPYHFQHGDKVRSIHVTGEQRDGLVRGQLGIVTLAGGYELLPRDGLEKVRERDAGRVVVFNEPDGTTGTRPDREDDPYAGYEIPDDLMW
ncbi:DUF2058 domain-containing protein [Thioalkalivibrio thiocyanodenitrificans]|uniref:DUF2058 domain-containing protein n=1 Tax=Thioalkalivibrio thiocyanodenitrificans TaxID=243063 RepID=UPI00037079D2|nr:DUF2058 domain-containing protein [Thioalkalivibrio thiocyanodenitrificans]